MNIPAVESYVQTIKGSSTTIGSQSITLACNEFCRASERNNIAGCHKALLQLIREFYHTKDVFKKIIELERKIIHLATKTHA
ncbi:hypothetical protein MKW94_029059 [Papaver nudicaule]|uniref:Histidine-containing phosphotransfer protein n=1 Tax=Papaver nudicaule TaxID=74823 RepID=A0AA41SJG3_PAPNU|nr:hypothetical protein [Papaver nudicaule]